MAHSTWDYFLLTIVEMKSGANLMVRRSANLMASSMGILGIHSYMRAVTIRDVMNCKDILQQHGTHVNVVVAMCRL